MPVKIQSQDTSNDARVITLTEYEQGRANFQAHYFLAGCNTEFGGQDIIVPWADFNAAVTGFINEYQADPSTVALRFVYAFNEETVAMKLRLQICTMTQSAEAANIYNLDGSKCAWYVLDEDGTMADAPDKSLHDPKYLQNMYYCEADTCDNQSAQNLAKDKPDTLYARTITFPWQSEVQQMYTDNGLPGNGYICFGACSYVNGGQGKAPIRYPHGMVIYLEDENGTPLLNDNDELVMFCNKGCDMATMCPTHCGVYVAPVS